MVCVRHGGKPEHHPQHSVYQPNHHGQSDTVPHWTWRPQSHLLHLLRQPEPGESSQVGWLPVLNMVDHLLQWLSETVGVYGIVHDFKPADSQRHECMEIHGSWQVLMHWWHVGLADRPQMCTATSQI